jgi:hypothetical protein
MMDNFEKREQYINNLLNASDSFNKIIKTNFEDVEFGQKTCEGDDILNDDENSLAYDMAILLLDKIGQLDRISEEIFDEIKNNLSCEIITHLGSIAYRLSLESNWLKILYNNIVISHNFAELDTFYIKNKHA